MGGAIVVSDTCTIDVLADKFLMTDKAVRYVGETKGWEVGVGPTVVAIDEGVAKNLSTSSLKSYAYAYIFSQQGLMARVSIERTKISRIDGKAGSA